MRARFRKLRDALTLSERQQLDLTIVERIRSLAVYKNARTIASYRAIDGEVSPEAVHTDCLQTGRTICYPKVISKAEMVFAVATGWRACRYGFEPTGKVIDLESVDLILVPGVAFSRSGDRVGFGGGYYDRVLKEFDGSTIGLAYPFQICESLPMDAWDIPVQTVITP